MKIENMTRKTLLVGMLYCGEQEFEKSLQSLHSQSMTDFDVFVIENQPNKLAHDVLYGRFMAESGNYDYFLKLDADMVLSSEHSLSEMIRYCRSGKFSSLLAYVKDYPSQLFIPGIQMFQSDTRWEFSDEMVNVDYTPKVSGKTATVTNKDWVLHMPDPSPYQMFRYGIHKAIKAIQREKKNKSLVKGILHMHILQGMVRHAASTQDNMLWLSMIGATHVFNRRFNSIEYNTETTRKLFEEVQDFSGEKFLKLKAEAMQAWENEIQTSFVWLNLMKS